MDGTTDGTVRAARRPSPNARRQDANMSKVKKAEKPPEPPEPATPEDEVYVGAIVLFKMPEGPGQGELRPAIVIECIEDAAHRAVALQVVTHKSKDANAMQFYDWSRRGSRCGDWQPLIKYDWKNKKHLPQPE